MELTDWAQKQEMSQKNLLLTAEKEKIFYKEKKSFIEQIALIEKSKGELQKNLDLAIELKENKHKQLLNSILLCHRYDLDLV